MTRETRASRSGASTWGWLLPAAAVSAVCTWLSLIPRPAAPAFLAPPAETLCSQSLSLKPGYATWEGALLPQGDGWRFEGESWLQGNLCEPGTLLLDVEGELAGSQPPKLNVTLNMTQIADVAVTKRRRVALRLTAPGRLTVGFLNDHYESEARMAFFNDLRLRTSSCSTFTVSVPPEALGNYDPGTRYAAQAGRGPITLQPCAAGRLSLLLNGSSVSGTYPTLEFRQGGAVLRQVQTTAQRQFIELQVQQAPVQIYLINVYTRELADRNLVLHSAKFTPEP